MHLILWGSWFDVKLSSHQHFCTYMYSEQLGFHSSVPRSHLSRSEIDPTSQRTHHESSAQSTPSASIKDIEEKWWLCFSQYLTEINGQLAPSSLRNISNNVFMQIKLNWSADTGKTEPDTCLRRWGKRGNRHRLEHRKFWLDIREKKITLRVIQSWNRLPREVVYRLGGVHGSAWHSPKQLDLIRPALSREQTKMTSRAPFWSELLYGSMKVILSIRLQIYIYLMLTRMHRISVNRHS